MTKIRMFEAFAGYGSQAMAMKRAGIPFEVVGISEIDKYAIQAYTAVHGETPNFGDISKIDWANTPDFNLFTYSFPCTDISRAGLQKGFSEGEGTRSGLLWECRKAIELKKPKYLLMENVKALTQKKFIGEFRKWQNYLHSQGYINHTQELNAKDYGVPQGRQRVFMVSILGDDWYNFPQPQKLHICLADVLEENVDAKYFLSEKLVSGFLRHKEVSEARNRGFKFETRDVSKPATAITTKAGCRATCNYIAEPKILQRGRGFNKGGGKEICPTITTNAFEQNNFVKCRTYIRKLTPRECFRLMDVLEVDIDKIQATGLSDTQQYKMAGNSIVVAVLEGIFRQLFLN